MPRGLFFVLFLTLSLKAQVGINTTLPQAQLDIRSSNQSNPMPTDGLLIPKIDFFPAVNPGTDQNGMMVFLTTTVGSNLPGFYYWNQPTLTWDPVKGDDGGTLNQAYNFGGPGAGRVINADVQDVEIIGEYGVSINKSNSASNQALNISNISQVNNAATLRINSTFENNLGVGIINSVGGQTSLSLSHTAIQNRFDNISPSSQGAVTAILNTMNNSNNTPLSSGVVNRFSGPGNGTKIGFANVFERTGSGTNVGLNNQFGSPNQSISTGLRNTLNFNFGGTFYGVYNQLDGTNSSTSIKYGLFNEFPASASGLKYGVYSDVRGATDYSGYFLGRVAIGSSTANTYILPLSRGSNGQVIQTDGAGNASWANATNFAWGLNGNAGTNPTTNFIGTVDNQDLVFRRGNNFYGKFNDINLSIGLRSLNDISTGSGNTAFGTNTGRFLNTGLYNTLVGSFAGFNITSGSQNTAFGFCALLNSSISDNNVAVGSRSLYDNTTGERNVAIGVVSSYRNTTGSRNVSIGNAAMQENTSGSDNVNIGNFAGLRNTEAQRSVIIGSYANDGNFGSGNYTSTNNVMIGYASGRNSRNTNSNVFVGYNSGIFNSTGNNNIAIGFNTNLPSTTASNQIRIGNNTITYAGTQVAWTITSDKRWKDNIQPTNLGLSFIKDLKPVFYTRKNDETQKVEYGLIAQELEAVLIKHNADTNGIISKDDDGMYGVRYNDLLSPMVKAIQEQQEMIETLQQENQLLKNTINQIMKRLENLEMN